jgi:hypothetical protein
MNSEMNRIVEQQARTKKIIAALIAVVLLVGGIVAASLFVSLQRQEKERVARAAAAEEENRQARKVQEENEQREKERLTPKAEPEVKTVTVARPDNITNTQWEQMSAMTTPIKVFGDILKNRAEKEIPWNIIKNDTVLVETKTENNVWKMRIGKQYASAVKLQILLEPRRKHKISLRMRANRETTVKMRLSAQEDESIELKLSSEWKSFKFNLTATNKPMSLELFNFQVNSTYEIERVDWQWENVLETTKDTLPTEAAEKPKEPENKNKRKPATIEDDDYNGGIDPTRHF